METAGESQKTPEEDPGDSTEFVERKHFTERIYRQFGYSVFGLSFLAIPIGVITAYGAWGFLATFGLLGRVLRGEGGVDHRWLSLIEISLGGLLFGIVLHFLKWERFRTPAHVIVASSENDGKLRAKDSLLTAIADALALALAAPVGRYGPAVYLGASIGSLIAQLLRLNRTSIRILLGCGVAAAISSAFNAPIAGVIFAHEVIIGHFRLRAFAPITLSSVAAVAITRSHHIEYVGLKLWSVPHPISLNDYPIYLLIGVGAALLSMAYMSGIVNAIKVAERARIPKIIQPMLGGLIAGGIAFAFPEILGLGDSVFLSVLEQDPERPAYGIAALLLLCGAKLVASVSCLGLLYPGGAFTPALFIGGMFGAAVGLLTPSIDFQISVLVGMGALVSSVIGAPLAVILIVFELTENYQAATAVMVAVVASNAIVTRYFARSLFHRQIRFWGIEINRLPEQRILAKRTVSEVTRREVFSLPLDRTFGEVRNDLEKHYRKDAYVVDATGNLVGVLPFRVWSATADEEKIEDWIEDVDFLLTQEDSLWSALERVEETEGLVSVPVVDSEEGGELVGEVFASDFAREYRNAVRQVRREEASEVG